MNHSVQASYEKVKAGLERLFQEAGYVDGELLRSLDELKESADSMRRELVRLKGMRTSNMADRMSSRLKEALRE